MAALFVLLAAGFALLALGAVRRVAPRRVPALQAAICLAGLLAALLAPAVAVAELGLDFAIDGLSSAVLLPLFLLGACGAAGPVTVGLIVLALLAADAAGVLLFLGAVSLAAPLPRWAAPWGRLTRALLPALMAAALLCLAAHGGWPDPRFAAIRTVAPGVTTLILLPPLAIAAAMALAAMLPAPVGGVGAIYLLARLLLDLPGTMAPNGWGALLLLAGPSAAVLLARRAACTDDPAAAGADAGLATTGLAAGALGVALLARVADLPPLTATAISAALLLVLTAGLSGALLLRGGAAGGVTRPRLAGLRLPGPEAAALLALSSMAALPLTPGFAAAWLYLQALLGAARLGGTATLALVAAALAGSGLVLALLAATAVRLAGLGRERRGGVTATPAAAPIATAALGLATVVLGLVPASGLFLVAPGVRLLAGIPLQGRSIWGLSVGPESPGYDAIGLAAPLLACTGVAAWLARSTVGSVPAWHGGLADDRPLRSSTIPIVLWPGWREWRSRPTTRALLAGLALVLAAALGWAAR